MALPPFSSQTYQLFPKGKVIGQGDPIIASMAQDVFGPYLGQLEDEFSLMARKCCKYGHIAVVDSGNSGVHRLGNIYFLVSDLSILRITMALRSFSRYPGNPFY